MEHSCLQQARTVFMGTPAFALPSLNGLSNAGARIVGVVTQPDKPAGRERAPQESVVAKRAVELRLPVFKPEGLRKEEQWKFLRTLRPDLLVVVAYGKILPKEVLELPKFGAVNVHASLLPKFRGPAPIPAAILHGDAETGVTIMKLDEGMDTGPLLAQEYLPIGPDDTTGSLLPRLADLGARLLVKTLEPYLRGEFFPAPQDETRATVCPMLKKDDGLIDWAASAAYIARMVRAYDPWPHASTTWNSKRLLILRAVPSSSHAGDERPGTVFRSADTIQVVTGEGNLLLRNVQLEGRKPLPAEEFVRGYPRFVGSSLSLAHEPVRDGNKEYGE